MNTMLICKQHRVAYSDAVLPVGTDCVYSAYSLIGYN